MTQAKADGGRTAHTLGPWQFCADHPQNACAYVKDADGLEIATIYGGGFDDGAPRAPNGIWGPQPSRDKVAHLIAAAPDLVKALESCQRVLADLVGGDKSLSTINIYAQAVEAELKARAALSSSRSDQQ